MPDNNMWFIKDYGTYSQYLGLQPVSMGGGSGGSYVNAGVLPGINAEAYQQYLSNGGNLDREQWARQIADRQAQLAIDKIYGPRGPDGLQPWEGGVGSDIWNAQQNQSYQAGQNGRNNGLTPSTPARRTTTPYTPPGSPKDATATTMRTRNGGTVTPLTPDDYQSRTRPVDPVTGQPITTSSNKGFNWRKLLTNPLTVGLAGSGLSYLLNGRQRNNANELQAAMMDSLRSSQAEIESRNKLYAPLREAGASGITNMLKSGSGSMLSPEGRTPYQLPEYVPGQRVSLGKMRSGYRTLPRP